MTIIINIRIRLQRFYIEFRFKNLPILLKIWTHCLWLEFFTNCYLLYYLQCDKLTYLKLCPLDTSMERSVTLAGTVHCEDLGIECRI